MHPCSQTITHTLGTKEPSPVPIASGTHPTAAAQTPPRCLQFDPIGSHEFPHDPPSLWPSRARCYPAGCTSPTAENTPNLPARCNADTPKQFQQLQGTTGCSRSCWRSGLARGRGHRQLKRQRFPFFPNFFPPVSKCPIPSTLYAKGKKNI